MKTIKLHIYSCKQEIAIVFKPYKLMIALFVFSPSIMIAQSNTSKVTSDSLYELFQKNDAFEVFKMIKTEIWELNYKELYSDLRLKPFFLKWIDKQLVFEDRIKQLRIAINQQDIVFYKSLIRDRLEKYGCKQKIDSIMDSPSLYKLYKDSVVDSYFANIINQRKNEKDEYRIPQDIIVFHSLIAYPESYTAIRQEWLETGKGTDLNNTYFMALLRMGDHDARSWLSNEVTKVINHEEGPTVYQYLIPLAGSSYFVEELLRMIVVDTKFTLISNGGTPRPFYCEILEMLVSYLNTEEISINHVELKAEYPCDKLMQHLPEIKAAAQKLIEKYKVDEYYWKKNMPFYKEGSN